MNDPLKAYQQLKADVEKIAKECGRDPDAIRIVSVSKGHEWDEVQPAYQAGSRDFGENRLQEALPKLVMAPKDIQWHLIGTLQKNKVKKVIGKFALIHSVDTPELAEKISIESLAQNQVTSILLQVNISGESSKHGFSQEMWLKEMKKLTQLSNIKIEGLMTMAPFTNDEQVIADCFSQLRQMKEQLQTEFGDVHPFHHLSMGMSNDYPIAIKEGATLIRVGSLLFGTKYNNKQA